MPVQCLKMVISTVELCFLVTDEGSSEVRHRTFAELYDDVAQLASAMKSIGIQAGDRVVGLSAS